jgi:hypothetical protein
MKRGYRLIKNAKHRAARCPELLRSLSFAMLRPCTEISAKLRKKITTKDCMFTMNGQGVKKTEQPIRAQKSELGCQQVSPIYRGYSTEG